jgi:hypothetical protein
MEMTCPLACCRASASQAEAPAASLTHLFLECPAYAQARQWLVDLWAAISPGDVAPPVTSAALMLGDCRAAWPSYPLGLCSLALLWTTLRVTFLAAIWRAYYSRELEQQTSAAVVREVVGRLREVIAVRFRWAVLSADTLTALPTAFLSSQLRPTGLAAFKRAWAERGVLCSVEEPAEGGGDPPRLRLWLSLTAPVAAPTN